MNYTTSRMIKKIISSFSVLFKNQKQFFFMEIANQLIVVSKEYDLK